MVAVETNDVTTIESIDGYAGDCDCVVQHYWFVNPSIIQIIVRLCDYDYPTNNIIDVGCNNNAFKLATHCIDFSDAILNVSSIPHENKLRIDIDFETIPRPDNYFKFCYCRHTLEDIQNPLFAFNEMVRCSNRGYIETPSPMIEMLKRVDALSMNTDSNLNYLGYIHHRYFVWTNKTTNTLFFLPKYPIIEYQKLDELLTKRMTFIANNYPVYWNNYYMWNETNQKPKVFVYRNGVNFEIIKDYFNLIMEAILCSFENTNHFIHSTYPLL